MREQVRHAVLLALATLVAACGETEKAVDKVKQEAAGGDDREGASANAEMIQTTLKNRSFETIAEYTAPARLDIVMIVGPGADREKLALAAPTLNARLRYTEVDYRLTIVGADLGAPTLSAQRPDLSERIVGGLAGAPALDVETALAAVLARGDAVRDGAELSIVRLGFMGDAEHPECDGRTLAAGALQVSACGATYAYFFDQLLAYGSDATHFRVTIPEGAVWDTLQVAAGEALVSGWKYVPGATEILIPRLVPSGARLKIRYEVDRGKRPNLATAPFAELGLP